MAFRDAIVRRALELFRDGRSAEQVSRRLGRDFPDEEKIPNERTIRRWKKENRIVPVAQETAVPSGQQNLQSPLINSRLQDHFQQLTEMIRELLRNDLDCVEINPDRTCVDDEYNAWVRDGIRGTLSTEDLALLFSDNINRFRDEHGEWELNWFCSHLEADIKAENRELGDRRFDEYCRDKPFEVIAILRILVARGTFRGTCDICEAWQ